MIREVSEYLQNIEQNLENSKIHEAKKKIEKQRAIKNYQKFL